MKNHTETTVKIIRKNGSINVTWHFSILQMKETNVCYIPGFDFYYNASTKEMAQAKANAAIEVYLDHFFIHDKKNAVKHFALDMYKRGFRVNVMDMKNLVRNNLVTSDFSNSSYEPGNFNHAITTQHSSQRAFA